MNTLSKKSNSYARWSLSTVFLALSVKVGIGHFHVYFQSTFMFRFLGGVGVGVGNAPAFVNPVVLLGTIHGLSNHSPIVVFIHIMWNSLFHSDPFFLAPNIYRKICFICRG